MTTIFWSSIARLTLEGLSPEFERRGLMLRPLSAKRNAEPFVHLVGESGLGDIVWHDSAEPTVLARLGVVVLTSGCNESLYRRAYSRGAAVARTDSAPATVVDVIQASSRGEILAPAALLATIVEPGDSLTSGELAVIRQLANGCSIAQAAERINYSDRHVRRLLQSAMTKAGVKDRQQVIAHFRAEISEN